MSGMLSPADRVVRRSGIIAAEMEGTIFVVPHPSDEQIELTGAAVRIWELLEEPRSIEEVTRHLLAETDAEAEACLSDTRTFVEELVQLGLVIRLP